jgi:hypothetical protein
VVRLGGHPIVSKRSPKIRLSQAVAATLLIAALAVSPGPRSVQAYSVSGSDTFTVGDRTAARVTYAGSEQLHITTTGKTTRYNADAKYTRTDDSGSSDARASFIQELMPNGSFEDRFDDDPDFLTVLNQPFAVALDAGTLRDLRGLHGGIPFDTPSPITGATLHGSLRRGPVGMIGGRPAIGVRFDASGGMRGPLPDRPEVSIDGTMRMDGVAYYAQDGALLLALEARLTITGVLNESKTATPVRIVYLRTIRANGAAAVSTEAQR